MLKTVLGILILVMALFLVVAVLMQSGSSKRLSGSIAGAAETFFGKNKGRTVDRLLSKVTNIVAVLFAVVVLASFIVVNHKPSADTSGETTEATTEATETEATAESTQTDDTTTTTTAGGAAE